MVIAGAGGHGLEVLEVLLKNGVSKNEILFFDEDPKKSDRFIQEIRVVSDISELKQHFITSNSFYLGVGNPTFRENLLNFLDQVGGMFNPLLAESAFLSHSAIGQFDAMAFSFIGPETKIGKGVLINTRAHVHHECKVGDFTDIGPGAMLLGNSQAGKRCRIGAGAVLLPGIKIGDDVIVGAGAVVTKNFDSGSKIVGVPAKPISINF
jgi:sugar O-acyltransferase (sialic acid O-acetyltransferase NeuD family)